jgi:hypothetical protein
MTVQSLRTPWRSEILSNRADSFFYSSVGVWSSVIALSPHENWTLSFWWDTLMCIWEEKCNLQLQIFLKKTNFRCQKRKFCNLSRKKNRKQSKIPFRVLVVDENCTKNCLNFQNLILFWTQKFISSLIFN